MAMLHMENETFIIAFLKVLLLSTFSLEVSVKEELSTYNSVWFITPSNLSNYLGKLKVAANVNPTDGYLDVKIFSNINRFQLSYHFFLLAGKRLKIEAAMTFVCESITVFSESPLLVHTDEEIVGEIPVSVSVRKSRVALIK